MLKLVMPVSFPFGIKNAEVPLKFEFDSNILRSTPKKTPEIIKFTVAIEKPVTVIDKDINHGGLIIPAGAVKYFRVAHEKEDKLWQAVFEIETEAKTIEKDISFSLGIFLQAVLNIFGYARVSPVIQDENGDLIFNSQLANLVTPGQDWFALSNLLQFSVDKKLFEQNKAVNSTFSSNASSYFSCLNGHLATSAIALDLAVVAGKTSILGTEDIYSYGKVLGKLIQQHPGVDYVPMLGLLTSFIEGLLKINGEHRYKFGIKISNLFHDSNLAPIVRKIYDSRSSFAHSAIFKSPNDIFEFVRIEFLLLVIKKILTNHFISPITPESFDFDI